MGKQTGWEMVVAALKAENVRHVFGLPGNPVHLYEALYDAPEIQAVLVRDEAAGGFMAMAYALVSGEPGVCFASPGPGVAKLVPALLEALATCAPVIAPCTGMDGHREGKGAFQETDQIGIMSPVTKWATRVAYPEKVPWAMRRAFALATNGQPGPIFLEIPQEVGTGEAEAAPYIPGERHIRTAGEPARVAAAVQLMAAARYPLLVAGGGLRSSGAHAELIALAELMGMPVLTTPSGRGSIPEDHPLSFGQVGLYRTRLGVQAVEEADLLITVGSRNEEFQTGAWQHFPKAPGAKFIQIDIEPFEIARNWLPDVPVVGDAQLVLSQLTEGLREAVRPEWASRAAEYGRAKRAYRKEVERECLAEAQVLQTKRLLYELNRVYGKDTILVHENGSQDLWSYYSPYYQVLDLNGSVAPGEQTCMGAGVAGAIGAKLARPDKKVVCITGDGAFQMANQELATAVQNRAPVTWIVLNNFSLGRIKYTQKMRLNQRHIAVDFEVQPDFVGLAEASECHGERIDSPEQVAPALERALMANDVGTPAVVECIIDPWDLPAEFHAYHEMH